MVQRFSSHALQTPVTKFPYFQSLFQLSIHRGPGPHKHQSRPCGAKAHQKAEFVDLSNGASKPQLAALSNSRQTIVLMRMICKNLG